MVSAARPSRAIGAAGLLPFSYPDIAAVALVGSYARGEGRSDSDVDLLILTYTPTELLEDQTWYALFDAHAALTRAHRFGVIDERRLRLPDGLEIEVGIGRPSWAATDPIDEGTATVVADGLVALYDPNELLAALVAKVRRRER